MKKDISKGLVHSPTHEIFLVQNIISSFGRKQGFTSLINLIWPIPYQDKQIGRFKALRINRSFWPPNKIASFGQYNRII